MADKISSERRSANMRAIRSVGTKPELVVRQLLHRLGYRFRLHRKDLPGKPDLVFPKRKAIVQVHGCFWHQHPDPNCKDARRPSSNTAYWLPKLTRNQERDAANEAALAAAGWRVAIVWECELKDLPQLQERLVAFLGPTRKLG